MKVIFLDIDGVLNSNDWYVKTRGIGMEETLTQNVSSL